jgi:thioredoxin 1
MTNYLHDKGTDYQELDVEEDAQLATKYGIASVPSLLLIDENGKILERVVGFNPEGIDYLVSRQ